MRRFSCLCLLFFTSLSAEAAEFSLPSPQASLLGQVSSATLAEKQDLHALGRTFDVGYFELLEANPGLDEAHPAAGSKIVIPSAYILPRVQRKGLVINLAEMRLYYFPPNLSKGSKVFTAPIGIGRIGWETPTGVTKIIRKKERPTWYPTPKVKDLKAGEGVFFPDTVEAGPDNPLGEYAFYTTLSAYLIHGTNDPTGIGMRSSAGCIRLFPEDIAELFKLMPVGTTVQIINQPYKIAVENGHLYLEAHQPLQESLPTTSADAKTPDEAWLRAQLEPMLPLHMKVDWPKLLQTAKENTGVPVQIS